MAAQNPNVFEVIAKIGSALEGLTPEEQQKALHGVAAVLGVQLPSQEPRTPNRDDETGADSKGATGNGKKLSIREFITACQPATNMQYITAFAAYRQDYEGEEKFAREDLQPYFAKAKIKEPAHYTRDFSKAVKEGYIHEDGKNSYLTATGENAVAAGFGGKGKARGAATKKKAKGNKN